MGSVDFSDHLSILGQPDARFREYEAQIRREYEWVAGRRLLRARVMKNLLENRDTLRAHLDQAAKPPATAPPLRGKGVASP